MICPECKKTLTNADAYGHDCEIDNAEPIWKALKFQYEPRAKIIEANLSGEALQKWQKASYVKKIAFIDKLQAQGVFGGGR